jgi:type IV pilus biogenesis protein CpaD/CtpE
LAHEEDPRLAADIIANPDDFLLVREAYLSDATRRAS